MNWTRYIDLWSWLIETLKVKVYIRIQYISLYTEHRGDLQSSHAFFSPRLFLCISKWNETLRRIWNAAGDERCERIYLLWVMVMLFIGETMGYVSLYFSPKKTLVKVKPPAWLEGWLDRTGQARKQIIPGLNHTLGLINLFKVCIIHHYCSTRRLCSEEWHHCIH